MAKYAENEAKEIIQDRTATVKSVWQNRRDLWTEIYKLYRFWTDTEPDVQKGERSNIFIPLAFSIIETKLPRLVQALLSFDPWFKVEGRNARDHKKAEFMSDVMQFQLTDEINAFSTIVMWWKEALMYSNSYMFVGWEKELAKLKQRYPRYYMNEIIGYDYGMREEVVYDGVVLNHLDVFDCFPAPYGTRINGRRHERMPYFILRSEPDINYLRSLSEKKDTSGTAIYDKSKVEEIIRRFPQGYGDLDEERKDRQAYNRISETQQRDKKAPKYVTWTMFEHDWWVTSIGDVVIRNKENPFGDNKIPIVGAVDTPVPHEHMGIGQIEPVIKLNYYANDLENLHLDFLIKSINPGALISQESFLDPAKFQQDPDGIHIVTGNPNNAYALIQRPNINALDSRNEIINIERLIDKVLGQSDVSRGVSRPGKDTATEIVSLIEQANFRFDLSVRLLKNESLIPMLDLICERNQLLFPSEKEIKKYTESGEPEFFTVPVSYLIGKYRFKMRSNPMQGNRFVYAQTLIRFMDVLNASQGQHPNLVREIAKYLEVDNIDELLDNPVQDAVSMIAQAANEGLLANSKQAAVVLAQVLNILAPPGSKTAKSIGGVTPQATDERGIARQMARGIR